MRPCYGLIACAAACWADCVKDFGRLPLADVLAPAIALAEEGVPIHAVAAQLWSDNAHQLLDRWGGLEGTPGAASLLVGCTPCRAEIVTPKGYNDPETSPTGFNTLRSDQDTIGCAYTIEWPSGWCRLSDVSSARSVGVDASFKNPRDEASTLAVFISDAGSRRSVADQGSLDKVAASRAESAPRQFNVGKRKRMTKVGEGGTEALTYDVETKVGGGTAASRALASSSSPGSARVRRAWALARPASTGSIGGGGRACIA